MKSKQGSGKRQLQERNFEVIVNHITINEDRLTVGPAAAGLAGQRGGPEGCFWTQHKEVLRHLSP